MKKILSLILTIALCLSFASCGKKQTKDKVTPVTASTEEIIPITVEPKIVSYISTFGLKDNGTVFASDTLFPEVVEWTGITDLTPVSSDVIGLKVDGTVVASNGVKSEIKDEVSKWTDIIDITSTSTGFPVGLKSDGTVQVVSTIPNAEGYSEWSDIAAIDCSFYHVIGLKNDGTCVASSSGLFEEGQANVTEWTDIKAIAAGGLHSVGLKSDGTVVATGRSANGECNVSGWTDIVAIDAGLSVTVGLKSDGTVVACGDKDGEYCLSELAAWTDISEICIGYNIIIGMKKDGTIVYTTSRTMTEDYSGWDLIS